MKDRWLTPLVEKYYTLPGRDRGMITVLTVFLTVVLVYLLVWTPVDDYRQRGMEDRNRNLELLEMMRRTETQARQNTTSKRPSTTGKSLLSIVSRDWACHLQDKITLLLKGLLQCFLWWALVLNTGGFDGKAFVK